MRPAIKTLHTEHRGAMARLDKLNSDMDAVRSKMADLDAMTATLTPCLAVDTGDIDAIVQQRLESARIQQKREVIGELRSDLEKQLQVLKLQATEQKYACNRLAGMAWNSLAESLVAENAALLKQIGQVCEKAGFDMKRFFSELPYLTDDEVKLLEEKEEFPQWL